MFGGFNTEQFIKQIVFHNFLVEAATLGADDFLIAYRPINNIALSWACFLLPVGSLVL